VHGFSTRYGGISPPPFDSLNLGGSEDTPENILHNRTIALQSVGFTLNELCYLKQVHGNHVCLAQRGIQEGDALVSNEKGKILAVSAADCYPILFYDEVNQVIGAAHAGWRGTVSRIAANTITAMCELGARKETIKVAIGQGISLQQFEVGEEVKDQFLKSGFPINCIQGKNIDLVTANVFVLHEAGILLQHIWALNRCTFESDFFSYRRDKGKTGRMWGVIGL
jgi:polyphenol oxidase